MRSFIPVILFFSLSCLLTMSFVTNAGEEGGLIPADLIPSGLIQGDEYQVSVKDLGDSTIETELTGQPPVKQEKKEERFEEYQEIIKEITPKGIITQLTRTYGKAYEQKTGKQRDYSYAGKALLFVRKDDGWEIQKLVTEKDWDLSPEDGKHLLAEIKRRVQPDPWQDFKSKHFPQVPVEIGESWKVPVWEFMQVLGLAEGITVDRDLSSVNMCIKEVEQGKVVIGINAKVQGKAKIAGQQVPISMTLTGHEKFSFDKGYSWEWSMHSESVIVDQRKVAGLERSLTVTEKTDQLKRVRASGK
ncbi:hypothetical protein ACFL54_04645 [Planctomycetota bacterium]